MSQVFFLPVPQAFDYQQNLGYLLRDANEVMFTVMDKKIRRVLAIAERLVLIEMSYEDQARELQIAVLNQVVITARERQHVLSFVSDFFDLDRDLQPFYQLAARDALLTGVEVAFYGLRLIGVPDFFEAISWGILGQQINLTFAYTLKRRLVEKFGRSLTYDDQTYWVFPLAERIATCDPQLLLELQLGKRKTEYLQEVARLIAAGEISKAYYLSLPSTVAVEKKLTSIRGIGPWTANYVMMRCLRLGDAFPMADVGLLNAIKSRQNVAEKPEPAELLALKERWGAWSGYATFYLWRLLY